MLNINNNSNIFDSLCNTFMPLTNKEHKLLYKRDNDSNFNRFISNLLDEELSTTS